MLDSRSHDLLILARVGLESAIRSEDDLLELLPPEPSATSTLRRSVENNAAPTDHAHAAA
jgi:hypothetical protein